MRTYTSNIVTSILCKPLFFLRGCFTGNFPIPAFMEQRVSDLAESVRLRNSEFELIRKTSNNNFFFK